METKTALTSNNPNKMKRIEIFFVLILIFFINANLKGQIQVINLADDFLRYYNSSKDLSNELKIENPILLPAGLYYS